VKRLPAAATLLLILLAACQPLYFPLIPEIREPAARIRLDVELGVAHGRPQLQMTVREVPAAGWLAIQWFSPANREAASESVWLEPDSSGQTLTVQLPADVAVTDGEWRALLSSGDTVLRQLAVTLP
jgi:hypothetical protein